MKKRILIVEDELLIQMVNKQVLEEAGYSIVGLASNAEEAIKIAQEEPLDLIIMDIKLEGEKDGVDAMMEIRNFSQVPVLYLTGNSDSYHFNRAKETGMADFLVKPIDFSTLISIIQKILNKTFLK